MSNKIIKLAVLGASGRMGSSITRLAINDPLIEVVAATCIFNNGKKVPNSDLIFTDDIESAMRNADVVIDFTLPEGVRSNIKIASSLGKPYVSGTTGLTDDDMKLLNHTSKTTPVFWAPNMSIGVTVLKNVIKQISSKLDDSFDIEILEMHHRDKIDAPSGTAISMGECAAKGRGRNLREDEKKCRSGGRQKGDIGFSAMRGGNVIADCSIIFAGDEEVIEIKHSALTRDMFAKGAIMAAKWVLEKDPGLYNMSDMLD